VKLCAKAEKRFKEAYQDYEDRVREKREREEKQGYTHDIFLLDPMRRDFLCKDKGNCECSDTNKEA